jgi:hypothetical protein
MEALEQRVNNLEQRVQQLETPSHSRCERFDIGENVSVTVTLLGLCAAISIGFYSLSRS